MTTTTEAKTAAMKAMKNSLPSSTVGAVSSPMSSSSDSLVLRSPSDVYVRSSSRYMVSIGTCTKIAFVSFTAGVFVGFSLNKSFRRMIRRWLKRLQD